MNNRFELTAAPNIEASDQEFWLQKIKTDFSEEVLNKIFSVMDADVSWTRKINGFTTVGGGRRLLYVQQEIVKNDTYLERLLSFCQPEHYARLHQRLTFEAQRANLLFYYAMVLYGWENEPRANTEPSIAAIRTDLDNWRKEQSSPKTQENFFTWLANYETDVSRYYKFINRLAMHCFKDSISIAAEFGHAIILSNLLSAKKVNKLGKLGSAGVHVSIGYKHNTCLELLIKAGADLQQGDPLRHAIDTGNAEGVKLLVKAGANIHSRGYGNHSGVGNYTPLHLAFAKLLPEAVLALLEAGANEKAEAEREHLFGPINISTSDIFYHQVRRNEDEKELWHRVERLLTTSKAIQCKAFCDQLIDSPLNEAHGIIAKFGVTFREKSAMLDESDVVAYLKGIQDNRVKIEYLRLATSQNVSGKPTNGLAYYLRHERKSLLEALSAVLHKIEPEGIVDKAEEHRSHYFTNRPYLRAYGPQENMELGECKSEQPVSIKELYNRF